MSASDIQNVFLEFFYGEGGWLGVIVLTTLILGIGLSRKEAALIFMPISVFIAFSYFATVDPANNLMWAGLIFLLLPIFLAFRIFKKGD